MFARDVEMFIEHCENKGLATKTIGSYEQTLRLLMLWLDEQGITQTEKITHEHWLQAETRLECLSQPGPSRKQVLWGWLQLSP